MTLIDVKEDRENAIYILWQLLQERPPEAWISHNGKTTYEQHIQFVLYHPYRAWYLLLEQGHYVGAVYLTNAGEIGIGVLKAYQRQGYARRGIQLLMESHPREHYLANVAPANHASHRLWESFSNHAICQVTYRVQPEEVNHG